MSSGGRPSGKKKGGKGGQLRILAEASAIGLSVVVAILLGLGAGLWLDGILGTRPWLTLVGLIVGVAGGLNNIFVMSARIQRAEREDSDGS